MPGPLSPLRTLLFIILATCSAARAVDDVFDKGILAYKHGRYDQARQLLSEFVKQPDKPSRAAEACYTLAILFASDGHQAETDRMLTRLIKDYPGSDWTLNACALLIQSNESRQNWIGVADTVSTFLSRYLTSPSATIDDHTSRHMYDRLVNSFQQQFPELKAGQIRRTLKERFPASTPTGRVVALQAGVDPNDATANLVLNPGFELDARVIGIPVGWFYRGTEPNIQDDADGAVGKGGLIQTHTGEYCVGKFTSYGKHRGWFYQRIPVLPGQHYDISVWGIAPTTAGQPGQLRLGVDVRGGMDPEERSVRWTQPISPEKQYERLAFEGISAIKAETNELTLFLELRQDIPASDNALLFDDVAVSRSSSH